MTEEEKFENLFEIYTGIKIIGLYQNSYQYADHFHFPDMSTYIASAMKLDIGHGEIYNFKENYSSRYPVNLKKLKENFNIDPFHFDNSSFYRNISSISNNFENFLYDFKESNVTSSINSILEEWITLNEKVPKPIEISEDIQQIKLNLEKLKFVNILTDLRTEINTIKKHARNLVDYNPHIENDHTTQENYRIHAEALDLLLNNKNSLINKDDLQSKELFLSNYKIKDILIEMETINQNIHKKFNDNGYYFSTAEEYIGLSKNKSSVESFLINKSDEKIIFDLKMSQSQIYSECIFFDDNSFAVKCKNGEYYSPISNILAQNIVKDLFKSYIDFKLRKNPTISKLFNQVVNNDFDYALVAIRNIDTYLLNQDIFKANGFDINPSNYSNFEILDDQMHRKINEHKLKQYAHSITSEKYRFLYNDETYNIFQIILDSDVKSSIIQDMIGKKLAAYKSPDEFNNALNMLLNTINQFNDEAINIKAFNTNANIIIKNDEYTIIEISDFNQSKNLGSSSWCISRDEHYFNSYTKNRNHQYFIFDFNKQSTDNECMIGLTLKEDGSYYTAHAKNDTHIKESSKIKNIQMNIISQQIKDYPNLNELLKDQLSAKKIIKEKMSI